MALLGDSGYNTSRTYIAYHWIRDTDHFTLLNSFPPPDFYDSIGIDISNLPHSNGDPGTPKKIRFLGVFNGSGQIKLSYWDDVIFPGNPPYRNAQVFNIAYTPSPAEQWIEVNFPIMYRNPSGKCYVTLSYHASSYGDTITVNGSALGTPYLPYYAEVDGVWNRWGGTLYQGITVDSKIADTSAGYVPVSVGTTSLSGFAVIQSAIYVQTDPQDDAGWIHNGFGTTIGRGFTPVMAIEAKANGDPCLTEPGSGGGGADPTPNKPPTPTVTGNAGINQYSSNSSALFILDGFSGSGYQVNPGTRDNPNAPPVELNTGLLVMSWEGGVDSFTCSTNARKVLARKVLTIGTDVYGDPIYRGVEVFSVGGFFVPGILTVSCTFSQAVKGDFLRGQYGNTSGFLVNPFELDHVKTGTASTVTPGNPNFKGYASDVAIAIVVGGTSHGFEQNWRSRVNGTSLNTTIAEGPRMNGPISKPISLGTSGLYFAISLVAVRGGFQLRDDPFPDGMVNLSRYSHDANLFAAVKSEVQYRYYSSLNLLKCRYKTEFGYHIRMNDSFYSWSDTYGGGGYSFNPWTSIDSWVPLDRIAQGQAVLYNPPALGTDTAPNRLRAAFAYCISAWADLGFEAVYQMPKSPTFGAVNLEPSIPTLIGTLFTRAETWPDYDFRYNGLQVRGRADTISPGVLRLGGRLEDGTDELGSFTSGVIVVLTHSDVAIDVVAHAPPTIDRPHEFYAWDRTKLDKAKINQALEDTGGFITDVNGTLPSSSVQASTWHGIPITAGAVFTAARVRGKNNDLYGVVVTGTGSNRTISIGQTGLPVLYTAPLTQWLPPGSAALANAGDPIMNASFMETDWPGPTSFLEFKPISGLNRVRLNLRLRSRKDVAKVSYDIPSSGPPGPAPPVIFAGVERDSVVTSQHTGLEWLKPSAIAVTSPTLPVTAGELERLNAPLPAELNWTGFKGRSPRRLDGVLTVTFVQPYAAPSGAQWALEVVRVWVRGSGSISYSGTLSEDASASSAGFRVLTLEPTTSGLTITFTATGLDVLAIRAIPVGQPV